MRKLAGLLVTATIVAGGIVTGAAAQETIGIRLNTASSLARVLSRPSKASV